MPSPLVLAVHFLPASFVTVTGAPRCGALETAIPPSGRGGPPKAATWTVSVALFGDGVGW